MLRTRNRAWRALSASAPPTLTLPSAKRGGGGPAADRVAKTLDPAADFLGARFQCRAVDDQPGAHLGDRLDLDQTIGFECGAGLDEIDDMTGEAETGRELDRTVELDAFGLHAARREVAAGDLRVLCRHPNVARAYDIVVLDAVGRRGHREAAMTDIEVEWSVNLGIVEFHQHIIAGDAELSGAEGDESGRIETADADQIETGLACGKAELP